LSVIIDSKFGTLYLITIRSRSIPNTVNGVSIIIKLAQRVGQIVAIVALPLSIRGIYRVHFFPLRRGVVLVALAWPFWASDQQRCQISVAPTWQCWLDFGPAAGVAVRLCC